MRESKGGILLAVGAVVGGLWLLTKRAEAKPPEEIPEEGGAGLTIEIIGPDGKPLPKNSPVTINEGTSGLSVKLTAINKSTKAGVYWPTDLDVTIQSAVGDGGGVLTLIATQKARFSFAANETKFLHYPMAAIPVGWGGATGQVIAFISAPNAVKLAEILEPITVATVAIIYSAGLTFTIS